LQKSHKPARAGRPKARVALSPDDKSRLTYMNLTHVAGAESKTPPGPVAVVRSQAVQVATGASFPPEPLILGLEPKSRVSEFGDFALREKSSGKCS
jgi:hypothetical protein